VAWYIDRPVILVFAILSTPYTLAFVFFTYVVIVPLSFIFKWVILYPWIGFQLKSTASYLAYIQIYTFGSMFLTYAKHQDDDVPFLKGLGFILAFPWILYGIINWVLYYILYYAFMLIFDYILFTVAFKYVVIVLATLVLFRVWKNGSLRCPELLFYMFFCGFIVYEINYDLETEIYCAFVLCVISLGIIGSGDKEIDKGSTMLMLMFSCVVFIVYGSQIMAMGINKMG